MKLTYTLLFFIPLASAAQGQTPIGQLRSNWCWAASIQMIAQAHCQNVSQCEIVEILDNRSDELPEECRLCGHSGSPDPGNLTCVCDDTIEHGENGNCPLVILKYGSQEYCENTHLILKDLGFSSTLEMVPQDLETRFQAFESELQSFGPFILFLSKRLDPLLPNYYAHAVVVNQVIQSGDIKLVRIKDPWSPCEGCEYYYSLESLLASEWVHEITPILPSACNFDNTLTPPTDINPPLLCAANSYKTLSKSYFKTFQNYFSPKENAGSIKYKTLREIEYSKILSANYKSNPFSDTKSKISYSLKNPNFQLTISVVQKPIKYQTLQSYNQCQIEGHWIANQVDLNCSFLRELCNSDAACDDKFPVTVVDRKLKIGTLIRPYDLVKYGLFNYTFQCFRAGGRRECVSQKDLPELGMFSRQAIPENKLIELLHIKTTKYDLETVAKYPKGVLFSR